MTTVVSRVGPPGPSRGPARRPSGYRSHKDRISKKPFLLSSNCRPHKQTKKTIQLLAVDHSARASMKNAASCEN